MFLQVEVASDVVKNSFNTNPDTVFGVLVSVLILAVVFLCIGMWRLVNTHKKEMKEIFERHEKSDHQKYLDMKDLSEKMVSGLSTMMGKLDELIRRP